VTRTDGGAHAEPQDVTVKDRRVRTAPGPHGTTPVPAGVEAEAVGATFETGGVTLHRQLFLVLRDQITRGTREPGSVLPSEAALGEQFGVSRITVRRALQDLADQGYVRRRHGRGTFVLERRDAAPPAPPSTIMDGLRKAQLETTVQIITVETRCPPERVRAALELGEQTEALYVLRVRHDKVDGDPLIISESWLPTRLAGQVTRAALQRQAMYEVLAAAGISMGRVTQEITAEMADPLRAQLLGAPIGAALLRLNRVIYDRDGQPVQAQSLFVSPARSHILMDIPAEHLDTAASGVLAHDLPRSGKS
jgi:GntR family transcriptional regulator